MENFQPKELEADVFVYDIESASLTIDMEIEGMFFKKPTSYMIKHINPCSTKLLSMEGVLPSIFLGQGFS